MLGGGGAVNSLKKKDCKSIQYSVQENLVVSHHLAMGQNITVTLYTDLQRALASF